MADDMTKYIAVISQQTTPFGGSKRWYHSGSLESTVVTNAKPANFGGMIIRYLATHMLFPGTSWL